METTNQYSLAGELIVIKVGTSTLEKEQEDRYGVTLDEAAFEEIADQARMLWVQGAQVAIVSSGAIAAGYAYTGELRTTEHADELLEKQRYACLGQTTLMMTWQEAFMPNMQTGQLLFTKHELETDEGTELKRVSLKVLEKAGVIIVNENNALSHDEIEFGDNDTLAALYAALLHSTGSFKRTRLVILSDILGVYADPHDESTVISDITDIDALTSIAGEAGSRGATGGMRSKFDAGKIAQTAGIDMHIAHGRVHKSVLRALDNEIGTRFIARAA